MKNVLSTFFLLVLPLFHANEILYSQSLGQLQITPVEAPQKSIPVFIDYPDASAVIVLSSIPNLQVRSNRSIVSNKSKPEEGRYIWLINPEKQELTISGIGYQSQKVTVEPAQSRQVLYYRVEPLEVVPVEGRGNLILTTEPAGATITIDGYPEFKQITPYSFVSYSVQAYQIRIEKDKYETVDLVIPLQEGKTIRKNIILTPTYGFVSINSAKLLDEFRGDKNLSSNELTLSISGVKQNLTYGKPIELPVNIYSIKLSGNSMLDFETEVKIMPGDTTDIRAEMLPDFNKTFTVSGAQGVALIKTDIKDDVFFIFPDQTFKGNDYSRNFKPGTYSATIKTPHSTQDIQFEISDKDVTDIFVPLKPDFERVFFTNLIPGFGQLAVGKKRGYFYSTMALLSGIAGTYSYVKYNDILDKRELEYNAYQSAVNENDVLTHRNNVISYDSDLDQWNSIFTYSMYTGLGIAGVSMLDLMLFSPKQGWRDVDEYDKSYSSVWGATHISPFASRFSSLIPGLGHILVGDERGWFYLLGTTAGLSYAFYQNNQIASIQSDIAAAKELYRQSANEKDAVFYNKKVTDLIADETDSINAYHISLFTGLGIYALSLVDALFLKPDYGWRNANRKSLSSVNVSFSTNFLAAQPSVSFKVKW